MNKKQTNFQISKQIDSKSFHQTPNYHIEVKPFPPNSKLPCRSENLILAKEREREREREKEKDY